MDNPAPPADDLMTRRQVAEKFAVTSSTIKNWARSSQVALTEIRGEDGRPRYSRAEVELLWASGFRGFESRSAASRMRSAATRTRKRQ